LQHSKKKHPYAVLQIHANYNNHPLGGINFFYSLAEGHRCVFGAIALKRLFSLKKLFIQNYGAFALETFVCLT